VRNPRARAQLLRAGKTQCRFDSTGRDWSRLAVHWPPWRLGIRGRGSGTATAADREGPRADTDWLAARLSPLDFL